MRFGLSNLLALFFLFTCFSAAGASDIARGSVQASLDAVLTSAHGDHGLCRGGNLLCGAQLCWQCDKQLLDAVKVTSYSEGDIRVAGTKVTSYFSSQCFDVISFFSNISDSELANFGILRWTLCSSCPVGWAARTEGSRMCYPYRRGGRAPAVPVDRVSRDRGPDGQSVLLGQKCALLIGL